MDSNRSIKEASSELCVIGRHVEGGYALRLSVTITTSSGIHLQSIYVPFLGWISEDQRTPGRAVQ